MVMQQKTGLSELIEAHRSHLRELQLQSARMGVAVPVHILTEIERYRIEISDLMRAENISPSNEACETLGTVGMYQLLYAHIMRLDGDIWRVTERIEKIDGKLDALLLALAQAQVVRQLEPPKGG